MLAIAEFQGDCRAHCGATQITAHVQSPAELYWRHRLRVNILDECLGHYPQLDIAINASEGQIVDLVAEGGNVRTLSGIQFHLQQVVAAEVEVRRDFERKRRVAA